MYENYIRYKTSPYCNSLCLCAKKCKDRLTEKDSGYPLVNENTSNGKWDTHWKYKLQWTSKFNSLIIVS